MDEGTYWQRVVKVANQLDMRTLLTSDEELRHAKRAIQDHRTGARTVGEAELAKARRLADACLHPDTGRKIFLPLRVASIVPANMLMDSFMLAARTPHGHFLAQFLNQTYNALHYWANRNATNTETRNQMLQAYLGATAAATAAAVGLNRVVTSPALQRLVPFAAVAAADVLNLGLMRQNEFLQGVNVATYEGEVLGKSKIAGAHAVTACIAGRVAAAAPILIIPPLVMEQLTARSSLLRRNPSLAFPCLMTCVGLCINTFVPFTFGMFKQTADISTDQLESEFQNRKDQHGRPITHVVYNKGI